MPKAKAPRAAKLRIEVVDGLGPKDVKKLRAAIRQVWQWSTPRKLVVKRCTGADGFLRCEKCRKRTPALKVDHIEVMGEVTGLGYIERMFCASKYLQGLCKKCHDVKTKEEREFERACC